MSQGFQQVVEPGDRLRWSGELVTVRAVTGVSATSVDLIVEMSDRGLQAASLTHADLAAARKPSNDGAGNSQSAIAALWGLWMQWATPRIRSAVVACWPRDLVGKDVEATPRRLAAGEDPKHVAAGAEGIGVERGRQRPGGVAQPPAAEGLADQGGAGQRAVGGLGGDGRTTKLGRACPACRTVPSNSSRHDRRP